MTVTKTARIIEAKICRSKIFVKAIVNMDGKNMQVGVYLPKNGLDRTKLAEKLSRKIAVMRANEALQETLSNGYKGTEIDIEVEAEP